MYCIQLSVAWRAALLQTTRAKCHPGNGGTVLACTVESSRCG